MHQLIDSYAQAISDEKQAAVIDGSAAGTEKRYKVLFHDYQNPDALRRLAGKIKDHTLHHLEEYLPKAEAALTGEPGAPWPSLKVSDSPSPACVSWPKRIRSEMRLLTCAVMSSGI